MKKLILNCVFHREYTPSLVIDQDHMTYECLSCEKKGSLNDSKEVSLAVLRNNLGNEKVYFGSFRELLVSRASDCYPLQIVLNSGVIIDIEEMTEISFYEDHLQIYDNQHTKVKIHYPHNKSDFSFRDIWIPYISISFITDAAS